MHRDERPTAKRAGLPIYLSTVLALLVLPGLARAQWATSGNDIHNTNTGNVGVGTNTATPAGRLEVRQIGNTGLYATILTSFGANEDTYVRGGSASATVHIGDLTATTSKLLLMENGGVVGIGTTTPGILNGADFSGYIPLHIKGSGSKTLMIDTNTPASGFALNDSSQPADSRIWQISQGAGSGKLTFSTYTDAGAPTHRLVIDRSGNVGIGNTSPAYKLDVAGSVNSTGLCLAGDCKTAWSQVGGSSQWTTSGSDIYYNTGNVGIGTTPSSARLHLYSSGNTYLRIGATLANQSAVAFNDDTNGQDIVLYRPGGTREFSLWTTTVGDAFRLTQAGNVGIGTASPGARLHVVGANGPSDNTATPAPTVFSVTGGTGGNGTWGASPGGNGGGITLTGGTGGVPVAGSSSATGGTGGTVTISGGTGGTSAFTTSGAGGSVIINGGAAGNSAPTAAAGSVILANLRGNVGVGTATPSASYKLDVAGSVNSTGLCLAGDCKTAWSQVGGGTASNVGAVNVSSGQFGANVGGGNFSFPASVGIGTASPGASLDIGGNPASAIRTSYLNFSSNNTGAADRPYFRGTTTHLVINGYGTNTGGTLYLNYPGDLAAGQTTSTRVQETLFVSATGSTGGGNVGIGNAGPAERLHVSGGNVWGDSANSMLMLGPGREVSLQRDPRSGAGTSGWLESNAYLDGAGNWQLRNTGAGGVLAGIRPTTFDVWTAPAGASPAWVQQFFVTNTTGYFAGSVGIGNTSPAYKLDVAGSVNSTGLCIAGDCKTAWSQVGGSSQWTTNGSNIYFSSGSVGIGTQTPTHTLEVAGTINASGAITGGTISATYQDVAEWVPSSQKLPAGTVVVLDGERANHVLASTTSYDTSVAGVVSERPGITLGEGGEGKLLVATTGRVKVKVDATRAPIRVGDLLVTSDKEGAAMRSEPVVVAGRRMHAPGTIIGKALEPLAGGTGEILVLLSLQ